MEVLIFSLIGGVFSLIGGILLIRSKKSADVLAKYATPFAAGVLLATAFTDLIPEAIHTAEGRFEDRRIFIFVLIGILIFFMLERFLRWFHHHHEHGKEKSSSALIITGDTIHNALDGVAIGAAFLIDTPTGIVTTLAVALHEIPQEIGDFGLLLRNGMSKSKVITANVLSAFATTVTALLTYAILDHTSVFLAYPLAITAGFFIYIASSDIIPEIHDKVDRKRKDVRPWLLLFGAVLVMIVSPIAHDYIDAGHNHEGSESHSEHIDYMVENGQVPPSIEVSAEKDDTGLTIHVMTKNFMFTPDEEGNDPAPGEGHAHLYVNGEKVTRLYSEWTFVPSSLLPDEFSEIKVVLSNNNHGEYHLASGEPISATVMVADSGVHEKESDHENNHSSNEDSHEHEH